MKLPSGEPELEMALAIFEYIWAETKAQGPSGMFHLNFEVITTMLGGILAEHYEPNPCTCYFGRAAVDELVQFLGACPDSLTSTDLYVRRAAIFIFAGHLCEPLQDFDFVAKKVEA